MPASVNVSFFFFFFLRLDPVTTTTSCCLRSRPIDDGSRVLACDGADGAADVAYGMDALGFACSYFRDFQFFIGERFFEIAVS